MSGGIRRGRGRPPRMALNSGHPGQNMNRGSVTITPISNMLSSRGGRGGGQNHGPQIPRLQPMSGESDSFINTYLSVSNYLLSCQIYVNIGSFIRGGMRKPGPGMMLQQQGQKQFQQQQQGGQRQQMIRGRGVGRPQGQFNHPHMQLLQRGGLAPTPRHRGKVILDNSTKNNNYTRI